MRWFAGFAVGATVEVGAVTVTEEEIVEFASRYDPQPARASATSRGARAASSRA